VTKIFLIAGEASSDALGAALMRALREAAPEVSVIGVGGAAMTGEGLASLFLLEDIAVMGLLPVLERLPTVLARIAQTSQAVLDAAPDCLVLIDAPDFTHRVARRVRRQRPHLPIVDYVSPSVWAWRPGRARAMRSYIDCVLALLPFEPDAYLRLEGPRCVYVGHPLVEQLDALTPAAPRDAGPLLVLPGSRRAEIARMTPLYGQTLSLLKKDVADLDVIIPVAPNMAAPLAEALRDWPFQPRLVEPAEKFAAFRAARAALVTSGAATLELALAGVPMVVAYRVAPLESLLRFLITVDSIVLPNLIAGDNFIPEFLQERATPPALAEALAMLLHSSKARDRQQAGFEKVRAEIAGAGVRPSARAARIVLDYARRQA